jgi:4-nitrophenyl phosphatase
MAEAIARAGHVPVEMKDHASADLVAVGNDFDLTYERLTLACRVAHRTRRVITPNLDPRLPIEGGQFLPGCGAIVQAVAVAANVEPVVVGKPEPPLFRMALDRLRLAPSQVAMVGDSVPSDIRGAHAVGMVSVLYAPEGAGGDDADITVRSFADLAARAGVA